MHARELSRGLVIVTSKMKLRVLHQDRFKPPPFLIRPCQPLCVHISMTPFKLAYRCCTAIYILCLSQYLANTNQSYKPKAQLLKPKQNHTYNFAQLGLSLLSAKLAHSREQHTK
jgi:hypothetical protein